MHLYLASAGSYPRIGETPELQHLRRTYAARERGQASDDDLRAAEDGLVRTALAEQEEAGLDQLTDGQIRWYDPISHLASKLAGIKITGLLRFFDTNFYFRQPVATGEIKRRNGLVLSEFEFAKAAASKPVKAVLTGPYTLARHTLAEHAPYRQLDSLTRAYTQVLAPEVEALAQAGAEVIQLDEPAILRSPADFPILQRSVLQLNKHKHQSQLALAVYFGDPQPLYERLQQLPVDILMLDFTYNPKFVQRVVSLGSQKPLGLGLVDGRNTRLEDPAELARQVDRILLRVKGEFCTLNPSCGLEYLPRDRARAKLHLLQQVRALVKGAR
ncbi:MAG: hypothetical protein ACE5IP_03765 [Terriglobia bacterium]